MNSEVMKKVSAQFVKEFPDMEARQSVAVGDTVVAHTKIIVIKKVQKTLTTAEKQAMKKAQDAGKVFDEMENLKSQPFRGVVVAMKGYGNNKKFVVRKIGADGIGVEKIIPLFSPVLEKLEIVAQGKPRRAKLYYLRNRVGKKALRVREKKAVAVPQDASVEPAA
ncbi:MAG: 50S ribosomal protein L19 [Candidatus Dojkabacteria bacterium]|nr:MAG: 50S ribosomal protein L19 [Candidatus Dojkabacteria bacterium]